MLSKISQKVGGLMQTVAKKVSKPASHVHVPSKPTIPNGAKKLQKSMDAMSANRQAKLLCDTSFIHRDLIRAYNTETGKSYLKSAIITWPEYHKAKKEIIKDVANKITK